jgi:hypothetical protein
MAIAGFQDRVADARAKMLDREQEAKDEMERLREEHQMAEAMRGEAKALELAELMKSIPDVEKRRIRLEVAVMLHGRGDLYGNQKQLQYDERTLELARYSITGQV